MTGVGLTHLDCITYFVVVCGLVTICAGDECTFPDFLASVEASYWYFRPRQDGRGNMVLVFEDDHNKTNGSVDQSPDHPQTRRLVCIRQFKTTGSYLISEMSSDNVTYSCVVFTKRTPNVISLEKSDSSPWPDDGLCNSLRVYPWPLIASRPRIQSSRLLQCPLVGGFLLVASVNNKVICPNEPYPSLFHSDCLPDQGVRLDFANQSCVPSILDWQAHQRLVCLDSWRQGDVTFGLLGERYYDPRWLYMISENVTTRHSVQMYVSSGLHLPGEYQPSAGSQVVMNLTRIDDQRECRDGAEVCTTGICQNTPYSQLCPHLCMKCDWLKMEPFVNVSCHINKKFHGHWSLYGDYEVCHVNVSDDVISFEGYAEFDCVRQLSVDYYVLATKLDHGCRPQYVCINLMKDTSSVMAYRLSQNAYSLSSSGDICRTDNFQYDPWPSEDVIRSKHFHIVVDDRHVLTSTTLCQLTAEYSVRVHWRTRSTVCVGTLSDLDLEYGPDSMILNLHCPEGSRKVITKVFKCVAHIRQIKGHVGVIITKELVINGWSALNCWIFNGSRLQGFSLTVLRSAQCNEQSQHDVINGSRSFLMYGRAVLAEISSSSTPADVTSLTTDAVSKTTGVTREQSSDVTQLSTSGSSIVSQNGGHVTRIQIGNTHNSTAFPSRVVVVLTSVFGLLSAFALVAMVTCLLSTRSRPYDVIAPPLLDEEEATL